MANIECSNCNRNETFSVDEFAETVDAELWLLVPTVSGLASKGESMQRVIVQGANLKLWPRFPMLSGLSKKQRRVYLRKALVSAYADYGRERQRQGRHEQPFYEELLDYHRLSPTTLSFSHEVAEMLEERVTGEESSEALETVLPEALARLTPREREVLELRGIEGWSFQKIATHIRVSRPHTFRIWRMAKAKLEKLLNQLTITS